MGVLQLGRTRAAPHLDSVSVLHGCNGVGSDCAGVGSLFWCPLASQIRAIAQLLATANLGTLKADEDSKLVHLTSMFFTDI